MRKGYRVAIRVDASTAIGSGHVMRCLALASALRGFEARVAFVCREWPGHLIEEIRSRDFEVFGLPARGDDVVGALGASPEDDVAETVAALGGPVRRIVVDHYGADEAWERAARAAGALRIVAIDDLPRRHDCDVLVDVNLSAPEMGHDRLVPEACELLLGPKYALLSASFRKHGPVARSFRHQQREVRRVLVSFGGGDVAAPTLRVIEALRDPRFDGLRFEIVVPESAPRRDEVAAAVATLAGAELLGRVDDMASAMLRVQYMLGAAGGQGLERCCMGLPSAVVTVAPNQEEPAAALAATGACRLLGRCEDVGVEQWRAALGDALDHPESRIAMGEAGGKLVDGWGAARVAEATLAGLAIGAKRDRVRPLDERDIENVWHWRNREEVRRVMFSTDEISWVQHRWWLRVRAVPPKMHPLIYESAGVPLGFVKFEHFDDTTGACEWGFYVGPPDAPHGTGSRMGWLALTYAFDDLEVASVKGVVTATNEPSLRYHDRLGFTRTGTSTRESTGGTVDVVEFVIDAARWREVAPALRTQLFGE